MAFRKNEKTKIEEESFMDSDDFSDEKETETSDIPETEIPEENSADEKKDLLKELFGVGLPEEEQDSIFSSDDAKKKVKEIFGQNSEIVGVKKEESDEETDKESDENYVALDDKMTEGTKEFKANFSSLEAALEAYRPQEEENVSPELKDEVKMSDSDNPYSINYDDSDDEPVKKNSVLPEEYTEPEQYDEFAENLRTRSFRSMCSAVWAFIVLLALLYLESTSFSNIYHPELLRPDGSFRLIYLLCDLQLVFISAIIMLPNVLDGIKNLFTGKPNRDSLFFLTVFLSAFEALFCIVVNTEKTVLFGSVAAAFAFFTALANSLEIKRIYRSFRIFATKKTKLTAAEVVGDSPENEAFSEYLEGEPRVYTLEKSDFCDGFFKKTLAPSKSDKSYKIVFWVSFVLSLAFAVFSYIRTDTAESAVAGFVGMAMMTLPLGGLFTSIAPFSRISKKAYKKGCAIAGVDSAEKYADSDVVSFVDSEIFPPKFVKINTIRTYGSTRIDKAILYGAMIFKKLGGPLSLVFQKIVSGAVQDVSEDFDFLEITADGMCAKIEDNEVFVGNKDYMAFYDFGYTKEESDEQFEEKYGRIMYMVIGATLAAKFYIKYPINQNFEKTLQNLTKYGICAAIKTCDPNIDTDLLKMSLNKDSIVAEVIKTTDAMKDTPVSPRNDSGIVCTTSISNMLKTFMLCESLTRLIKTNVFMKILSVICGAGVTVFLYLVNHFVNVNSLFVLIYDLIWMIPIIIPSFFE